MAASAGWFALPPKVLRWWRSREVFQFLARSPSDFVGRSIIYAREKPFQASVYGGGFLTFLYARSVLKAQKHDPLGEKAVFIHPENRSVRDGWGYRVVNDVPPMFRTYRNLEEWYFVDELRQKAAAQ